MITLVLVFGGALTLLHLLDCLVGWGPRLLGMNTTFVKVNLAILSSAAFSTPQVLGATSPDLVIGIFLGIAVADTLWAGYLARRDARQ